MIGTLMVEVLALVPLVALKQIDACCIAVARCFVDDILKMQINFSQSFL
jgi:hypothetical protein